MVLGEYNDLHIHRSTEHGLYLIGTARREVLLPNRYVPENFQIGDPIRVFLYLDNAERWVATTDDPYITLGKFAYLECAEVSKHGAFLDWGLVKQLFVPFREQRVHMKKGHRYVVYLLHDEKSRRLLASSRVEKNLQNLVLPVENNQLVNILIYRRTDIGWACIINGEHAGLLYQGPDTGELSVGDEREAYIRRIRPDGKIDLSLRPSGFQQTIGGDVERLLAALAREGGELMLTDKSPPDLIRSTLQLSKKAFKKAVGNLYRARRIEILPDRIRLLE